MRGILIWLITSLYVAYAFCLNTAAAVFGGAIREALELSHEMATLVMGAYIVGYACGQIPAGYFLDRYSPRIVIASGLFILTIGNIFASQAEHAWGLLVCNLIQGIGGAFAFIAAGIVIAQWFSPRWFPILFGITQTIACILSAVFHYQILRWLHQTTWDHVYAYLSVIGGVLWIAVILLVKRGPRLSHYSPIALRVALSQTLHNRQMGLSMLGVACAFGGLLAYASYWYKEVQNYYQIETFEAQITGGLILIGIGVGTPLLAIGSDLLRSRMKVIHSSLVLGTMALLVGIYFPFATRTIAFLTGFFLSGSLLLYTVVSENADDQFRGVALSVTNTAVFLMNTVMLFFPFWMKPLATTPFFNYLWVFPFLMLVAILVVYYIRETFHE